MAWQQDNSYGGYSSYGNYGEGQYGGDSATLDMFDDGQQPTEQTAAQVQPSAVYDSGHDSYYNPNAYSTDQNTYRPPSQQSQPYQRGPTPSNAFVQPNTNSSQAQQPGQPAMFNPNAAGIENFIGNPMVTGMAMQYSQDIMGRGGEEIKKNLDKYVSIGESIFDVSFSNDFRVEPAKRNPSIVKWSFTELPNQCSATLTKNSVKLQQH